MTSIIKATPDDYKTILDIGNISVRDAHKDSCSAEDLNDYMQKHYNEAVLKAELSDPENIYHIIYFDGEPAGFSKIVLNASHSHVPEKNVTKLDRIYLLDKFFDKRLGSELLQFNIDLAKQHKQSGIWLFTWVGNERAINFYLKKGFSIIGSHHFQVSETHSNLNHHMFLHLS